MTNRERQFLEYWEDQRKGSKLEYYLTYGFGWTMVIFLSSFFLLKIILDEYSVGSMTTLYIIAPLSILLAIAITHFTYTGNEKKYRRLTNNDLRF